MKKFYFKYLNGLVLFIVALTLTIPLSILAIVYTVVKCFLIGRVRDINDYFLNNSTSGAFSATGLTSGSKNVQVSASANLAGLYLEIKEAVAAASTQGMMMLM